MRAVVGFRTSEIESDVVWITESRRGISIGVFHPAGDVHITWHRDGKFHMKGPGITHGRHQRSPLATFAGWQQVGSQAIPFLMRPGTIAGRPTSSDPRFGKRVHVDRRVLGSKDTMLVDAFLMSGEGEHEFKKWLQRPQEGSEIIGGHILDLEHFPYLKIIVVLSRFVR